MSTLSLKNVKIQDPTGTLVSTLSYDGTNITIDKPVLAPTAAAGTNNTQLATTAMVHSAITNDLHVTGSAPMYACRAWVNFDGTQSTPAIRASGNVSSITKNGTADYTINFTTAMPDANYSVSGSTSKYDSNNDGNQIIQFGGNASNYSTAQSSTSVRALIRTATSNTSNDVNIVTAMIFR
jgi:hypothetical protein